jgi:hypothetical protein
LILGIIPARLSLAFVSHLWVLEQAFRLIAAAATQFIFNVRPALFSPVEMQSMEWGYF